MKRVTFLMILVFFLFRCSLNNEEIKEQQQSELRAKFIANKSPDVIRIEFIDLPLDVKQKLWTDKLNSLIRQNFSTEIKDNIKVLKDFLENYRDKEKFLSFKKSAILLSDLIPNEDFKLMFNSLENYDYNGHFIDNNNSVSKNFTKYISDIKFDDKKDNITKRRGCNCTWCLFIDESTLTSNCDESRYGCGFLFLQSCSKATYLFNNNEVIIE